MARLTYNEKRMVEDLLAERLDILGDKCRWKDCKDSDRVIADELSTKIQKTIKGNSVRYIRHLMFGDLVPVDKPEENTIEVELSGPVGALCQFLLEQVKNHRKVINNHADAIEQMQKRLQYLEKELGVTSPAEPEASAS
jgi:hypothetical protein